MAMNLRSIPLGTAWFALIVVVGCGSESGPITGTSSGTASQDGGASPGTNVPTTPNTCTFDIVDGSTRTAWTGSAHARMNGGNLEATCTGGSDGNGRVEIGMGNASFNGPRVYYADESSLDGTFSYRPGTDTTFLFVSGVVGGSCEITLTQAPHDAWGSSVPSGGVITATFKCSALIGQNDAAPKTLVIENGAINATVQ